MKTIALSLLALSITQFGHAIIFNESEPNNTIETANQINGIRENDVITGHVETLIDELDVEFGNDNFKVTPEANLPFLIQRHQIINVNQNFFISLHNRNWYQETFEWYSFGTGSSVNIRAFRPQPLEGPIAGNLNINYKLEYHRLGTTVRNLGAISGSSFQLLELGGAVPGRKYFNALIFDQNGRIVPGGAPTGFPAWPLNVNLAPGTYTIAIGPSARGEVSQVPVQTMPPLTFAGGPYLTNSQAVLAGRYISMSSSNSNIQIPVAEHYEFDKTGMQLYSITVVPEPISMVTMLVGCAILSRKNSRKA